MTLFEPSDVEQLRRLHPALFPLGGVRRWAERALYLVLAGAFLVGLHMLGFEPQRLWAGLLRLGGIAQMMWPPASDGMAMIYVSSIAETVAMAFLGSLAATLLAVPLGFLGAKNTMPFGPLRFLTRRSFDVIRGIDALIWAIVFVSIIGLGPFAGILAIAVNDTGVLAKLYAEVIENAEAEQSRGVRATGASRLQVIRFSILPQVLPVFIGNSLYFFEANVRSATILGIVGAGGIGFHLMDRIMLNAWPQVAFIIILILLTVAVIDAISYRIRRRII